MSRLAAMFSLLVVACSSFLDQVPASEESKKEENGTVPSGSAQLPPSSNPKSGTAPSNNPSTPTETSPADAGASDASSTPVADASTKDATAPAKLAFGQSCTDHAQCAGGICIPFEGKGFRCTKVCQSDSECPSNDCKDDPEVCDVD